MPWHLSKSDPRKVYDECHEQVGVMQTPEYARLIVDGVNAFLERGGVPIRLREPKYGTALNSDGIPETFPLTLPRPVHTHQAEGCCARALGKASLAGTLDNLKPFECPKCGTAYHPRQEGPVTNWEARADVLVFAPRS